MLDEEQDRDLRHYAIWLHQDLGEDAYHNAVCDVLRRGVADQIITPRAWYRLAIKRALFKLFRHEQAERVQIAAYIAGDPPPTAKGLAMGRHPLTMCRKGLHVLSEENLAYIGPRRTCKRCKQEREAAGARLARARSRVAIQNAAEPSIEGSHDVDALGDASGAGEPDRIGTGAHERERHALVG